MSQRSARVEWVSRIVCRGKACANGMSVRCEEMPQAGPQDWLISAGDPAHNVRARIAVPRLFTDCVSVAETIKIIYKDCQ